MSVFSASRIGRNAGKSRGSCRTARSASRRRAALGATTSGRQGSGRRGRVGALAPSREFAVRGTSPFRTARPLSFQRSFRSAMRRRPCPKMPRGGADRLPLGECSVASRNGLGRRRTCRRVRLLGGKPSWNCRRPQASLAESSPKRSIACTRGRRERRARRRHEASMDWPLEGWAGRPEPRRAKRHASTRARCRFDGRLPGRFFMPTDRGPPCRPCLLSARHEGGAGFRRAERIGRALARGPR